MTASPHPRIALIGAGAVASAIGPALRQAGFSVPVVVGRTVAGASELAEELGATASDQPLDAPGKADWVCCCVPDDALDALVDQLTEYGPQWQGSAVFHTSGARSSTVLERLERLGASTLSFHPVQTFTMPSTPQPWRGISVGIEGTEAGLRVGRRLALALGARPFEIATIDKPLYHAAASVASNYTVTLAAMASELLGACELPADRHLEILRPLLAGTLRNLERLSPEQALTGPIARGDVRTVHEHLVAVGARTPHLLPNLCGLITETVRLAVRAGRLHEDAAVAMLHDVSGALQATQE